MVLQLLHITGLEAMPEKFDERRGIHLIQGFVEANNVLDKTTPLAKAITREDKSNRYCSRKPVVTNVTHPQEFGVKANLWNDSALPHV